MKKLGRIVAVAALVIGVSAACYRLFIYGDMMRWGASDGEVAAAMLGDDAAPFVSSTRAVSIDAPRETVWKWLVQLGADRGGFYSYTFLERLLGYENGNITEIVPEFQGMRVGRLVPSTPGAAPDDDKPCWPVLAVEPGRSFVLGGWGAFSLNDDGPGRTRLIVRTHGWPLDTLATKAGYFGVMPLHFIMERRMLLGIKARAEAGPDVRLSPLPDYLWLAGLAVSLLGILFMIVAGRGVSGVILPVLCGLAWLWVCLVFEPVPIYALSLTAVVLACSVFARQGRY